ncbi:unnamed protein product [Caenorhabditis auriculariae]|uniref:Reverse transcriptase domain-containing protein n=1 Tax=Caenorhabditis auriculariae TaxID=2777116 RepID=A0A8S1GSZ0_9PELO|nr:unnamed protein product [Caenorhabditis auriculariae]
MAPIFDRIQVAKLRIHKSETVTSTLDTEMPAGKFCSKLSDATREKIRRWAETYTGCTMRQPRQTDDSVFDDLSMAPAEEAVCSTQTAFCNKLELTETSSSSFCGANEPGDVFLPPSVYGSNPMMIYTGIFATVTNTTRLLAKSESLLGHIFGHFDDVSPASAILQTLHNTFLELQQDEQELVKLIDDLKGTLATFYEQERTISALEDQKRREKLAKRLNIMRLEGEKYELNQDLMVLRSELKLRAAQNRELEEKLDALNSQLRSCNSKESRETASDAVLKTNSGAYVEKYKIRLPKQMSLIEIRQEPIEGGNILFTLDFYTCLSRELIYKLAPSIFDPSQSPGLERFYLVLKTINNVEWKFLYVQRLISKVDLYPKGGKSFLFDTFQPHIVRTYLKDQHSSEGVGGIYCRSGSSIPDSSMTIEEHKNMKLFAQSILKDQIANKNCKIEYDEIFKIPEQWKVSKTILIPKKGDLTDLNNFRPISLLSVVYKLFTKIIVNRLEKKLDDFQPPSQAGFRRNFCCLDHIHTLTQVVERHREYHLPLALAFVDYRKAFDSVEINAILNSLVAAGIPTKYIDLIEKVQRGNVDYNPTVQ